MDFSDQLIKAQRQADVQRRMIHAAQAKQRRIEHMISFYTQSAMSLNNYFVMSAVYAAFRTR